MNRYAWTLLAYLFVMQAVIIGVSVYSFTFFVVPWMEAFAVDRSTLMIAVSGASIATAALSPLCGYLLDRYSSKKLLLLGAASFAICLLAISRIPNAALLILLYILVLPFGMVLSGSLMASSMVARNFVDHRGLALGISALGLSAGGFIMPLLVTQLLSHYSWQTLFVHLALIVIVIVILPGMVIIREDRQDGAAEASAGSGLTSAGLMLSPEVLKLGVAFFSPVLVFVAVLHNLGALAVDYAIAPERAAWVVSIASLVMASSKLASGVLVDRISHKVIYLVLLLGQVLGLIVLSSFSDFPMLVCGVSLVAIGAGGNLPVIASFAAIHWEANAIGRVMGVVFAMAGVAGIGPVLVGLIRDASGSYTLAFLALMVVILPALWSFLSLSSSVKTGQAAA